MSLRFHIAAVSVQLILVSLPATAQVRIAVAASAGALMEELAAEYHRISGTVVETVTGPSGVLSGQVLQGAPFDLLFSADTSYPGRIERAGLARSPVRVYAVGSIALLSRIRPDSSAPLKVLLSEGVGRVAVANPALAPYGGAAIDALSRAGILEAVRPKLVYAESITHVNHFLQSGAVEAGITVPSSIAFGGIGGPEGSGGADVSVRAVTAGFSDWYLTDLGAPGVPQGAVLLGGGTGPAAAGAAEFLGYVLSPAGREVIVRAGYRVP